MENTRNHSTNTSVIGIAGAVSLLVVAGLHYLIPGFMDTISTGGDIAITTIVTGLLGYILPSDFLEVK
jgi:hypothetical protein